MQAEVTRSRSSASICRTCGRPLTEVGPGGECLRCLVEVAFPAEEAAHVGRRRSTPGRLRYAHFEVEVGPDGFPVELGSGAMAVTYRARDTVLNSTVALKVIDCTTAGTPGARARFLREARAAARMHHPNVARVTHYGEQDGECFYVMELVEGETLEDRVRRDGPMPLALALEVMAQAARALAAAEAHGIVHRDIKPSNLMIESEASGSMLVKVIDYGVAKTTSLESSVGIDQTQSGFVGTPAFASPEQFAGAAQTPVDTRSDIYSLGVTLWYLLAGRTPFVGHTLEDVRARQSEELPLEQLRRRADVPAPVLALVKSMLAVDPAERPQSARELLAAVNRCYVRFEPRARLRRKHIVVGSSIAAFLLAATLVGAWFYRQAEARAQREKSIAVLPFENLSAAGADAFFTVAMQSEIAAELSRFANLRTIGPYSTRWYPAGTQGDLRAIGRELGVRHLLQGSVRRGDGTMQVSLRLVDLRDPAGGWEESYERAVAEIFALRNEITRAVATRLRATVSAREMAALDLPPTTDLHAYELYLRARALRSEVSESVAHFFLNGRQAIAMLDKAVARDPNFLGAYCELARWHDDLYFQRQVGPPEERAVDHRSLAEIALAKARRLQPEAGAVHLASAKHALQINRDPEHAEYEIQRARQTLPNDPQVESIAGRIARRADRWEEAVRCFERAVSLEPREVDARILLAQTYRCMRRYEDFDRHMAAAIALTPVEKRWMLPIERALGRLESSADMAPLRAAFAEQSAAQQLDDSDRASAEMNIAVWSKDADAIARFLATPHAEVTFNGVAYPDAWFEALAARMRGDNPAALAAFTVARAAIEKRVVATPAEGVPLSILAIIDAGLGHKEQAIQEAKRACELSTFDKQNFDATTVRCNLAVVYAWTGEIDLAIAKLTELIERPAASHVVCQPTFGDFQLNPLWDPLRGDPRFAALVAKLAPAAAR